MKKNWKKNETMKMKMLMRKTEKKNPEQDELHQQKSY